MIVAEPEPELRRGRGFPMVGDMKGASAGTKIYKTVNE